MHNWYMLAVVGKDKPGIVAQLTHALYVAGAHLGEASMTRLGDTFTIMLMVSHEGDLAVVRALTQPVATQLQLMLHLDQIEGRVHPHSVPDARLTVFGADRSGIVAQVTTVLAQNGFNILDLQSEVAGTAEKPLYVMQIEGCLACEMSVLETAVAHLNQNGIEVHLQPIDMLLG